MLKGRDARLIDVSGPGLQVVVRKRRLKRAKRPHSKINGRKALNGPAMRPVIPLALENSVGKLAAKQAPNASAGDRKSVV